MHITHIDSEIKYKYKLSQLNQYFRNYHLHENDDTESTPVSKDY